MSTTTGLSVEDFLARDDWPPGAELVDGEVVVMDARFGHQEIAARILDALRAWVREAPGRGRAGFGGNWALGPGQVYKPDVWWCREGRVPDPGAVRWDDPPDLAVEVRSPSTWSFDVNAKRRSYEAAGTPELWLADPPARSVLVLRRSSPRASVFDVGLEVASAGTLTSPLLEGFGVEVATIFEG